MYLRRVIRIRAEDSPNVAYALHELRAGKTPSGKVMLPGVLDWPTYQLRRKTWDQVRQCISLDGEFYKGAETLMFPPVWLNASERFAATLPKFRKGEAIGVDPAEGGDHTTWAVVDQQGLVYLETFRTPNTAIIMNRTLALMQEYGVAADNVLFDRGGGGKEHSDYMRERGYRVNCIGFGEPVAPEPVRHRKTFDTRTDERSERFVYAMRNAQMYHMLRLRLEPEKDDEGNILHSNFGIPAEYAELRRQLSPIPLMYDDRGRIKMLPKHTDKENGNSLTKLLGRSPDDADALVLAVYAMDPAVSGKVKLKAMSF